MIILLDIIFTGCLVLYCVGIHNVLNQSPIARYRFPPFHYYKQLRNE